MFLVINFSLHMEFSATLNITTEPSRLSEVLLHPYWQDAMKNEFDALERNKTWPLTHLPIGKKALGYKWVFKIKRKSCRSIERYKASLVILGNT